MVSSLIHILIVTPVIFAWSRERELTEQFGKSAELQGDDCFASRLWT